MAGERFLLGQLNSNGDCLYTTILARQLKHDYPGCHLTWAISSLCKSVLRNNPHVDEVWEIPVEEGRRHPLMWRVFEREALRRLQRHEFDHAWFPQISPSNFQNYDGTVRPSLLRAYGRPVTVPIENVIVLDAAEQQRVADFVKRSGLAAFEHRILFECSSFSKQSFITPELAQAVAARVYAALPGACVLFSTNLPMTPEHANSRYAGELTLRETAGLTHHCTLFVGAGSGGTVAATSTAAKRLPMIQLLAADTSMFASFLHDFEHYGLPHEQILETTREDPQILADAIVAACTSGIAEARARFHAPIRLQFGHYRGLIEGSLIQQRRYIDAAQSLEITAARYGWRRELLAFARETVVPRLPDDLGWFHAHRRRAAEAFAEAVARATPVPDDTPQKKRA